MAKTATSRTISPPWCAPRPARARRVRPAATARCPPCCTATAPIRSTCCCPPANCRPYCATPAPTRCWSSTSTARKQLALPKALDIHPIRRNIQHVDLIIVRRGEKVTVEVNVVVEGDAGPDTLVNQEANTIEIESDAMSIPEHLTLSVEGIPAGTQFTAAQVPLPDGVTLVSDPELLVVNVIPAPTAADLESEGGGDTTEAAAAAEDEEATDEASEADAE